MPDSPQPESLDDALRRKAQEAERSDNLAILRGQPEYQTAHPSALERWRAAPADSFRSPEDITKRADGLRRTITGSAIPKGRASELADAEAVAQERARKARQVGRDYAALWAAKGEAMKTPAWQMQYDRDNARMDAYFKKFGLRSPAEMSPEEHDEAVRWENTFNANFEKSWKPTQEKL